MIIESIDLSNFRNYESLHLDFSQGIHIFYGDNARGKTNLLEAVCLASTNKSHRGAKDREMIRFGEEEAHIKLVASKGGMKYRVDMHLKKNKNKGIAVNSVPVRKAREFLGVLNCVFFSPEDLQIVKEGPAERRKFIDAELSQLDPVYLNAYVQYKKALEQRNQLLKDIAYEPSLKDTLDVWDSQLVSYGRMIVERRSDFIEEIGTIVKPVHRHLSGDREELQILYEPDVLPEEFEAKLDASRDRDMKLKTTNVGPHRDDMNFLLNGIDARIYGSQGQQRTSALSLKMAEIELVKRKTKESPVLLLDDVLSELDTNRQAYLLSSISDIQTFITCTGLDEFVKHHVETDAVFYVSENGIERKTDIDILEEK